MRKLLWLTLAFTVLFLLVLPASAEETARDLSSVCKIKATDSKTLFRLTDGKTEKYYEGKKNRENVIEFETPSGEQAAGLYILWKMNSSPVALDIWDSHAGAFVENRFLNDGTYLHEYVRLDPCSRFRLRSTDKAGTISLSEITVLSPGIPPDWVQAWEPCCTKADLLIFVAHPDDEFIFLGGTIPWYAIQEKKHVCVAYMTLASATRYHELLNGLWTAGVREYPYLLRFKDWRYSSVKSVYQHWGETDALDAVRRLINDAKPEVIVTQDVNGEYGHNQHKAVCDLMLRIVRDGEVELEWHPKKLYVHLYEENKIEMDWNRPMDALDGTTALAQAETALRCHRSQYGQSIKTRSGKVFKFVVYDHGMYDNSQFGLAWSSVGPDLTGLDFLENIP